MGPATMRWQMVLQLKVGETVVLLGAAVGVGTAAIQITKAWGPHVIAAASDLADQADQRSGGIHAGAEQGVSAALLAARCGASW